MEMLALTKAIAKIMKDFANINIDVKSLQKDNDRREIS